MTKPISLRALNRATLARQLLLKRQKLSATEAISRLAGMQAQVAWPPFVGLWTRLDGFQREQLLGHLHKREVLRATAMRGTLHYLTAKDYDVLRPALQSGLSKGMEAVLRDRAKGLDVPAVLKAGRKFLAKPAQFEAVREHLLGIFPKVNDRALGFAVRMHLPLSMVPDASRWGFPQNSDFALVADPTGNEQPHELVRRYLAAFGPASVADAQAWSGLQGLKATFESMRDELEVFEDERGRALFDLPKAPRPGDDGEAPVRLLPDFDNLVLAHDDRTRLVSEQHRKVIVTKNLLVLATFLVDGFVAGTWKIERKKNAATLRLTPFGKLAPKVKMALEAEAEALLGFTEPEGTQRAVITAA